MGTPLVELARDEMLSVFDDVLADALDISPDKARRLFDRMEADEEFFVRMSEGDDSALDEV